MTEPFKNLLDADVVGQLRRHLIRVDPGFDGKRFAAGQSADQQGGTGRDGGGHG